MNMNTVILHGQAPAKTPIVLPSNTVNDSPALQHPYQRPEMSEVTIRHWLYDLQKNAWLFNEKTIRYELASTTILNIGSRKKKLFEMGMELHSSWVNLLLHLGLVISQQNSKNQQSTSKNLNKLVVATGLSEVLGIWL
jgi:hypothetical protein